MSYSQAMKWCLQHPKGTRQPVIMSTGSGFWPSRSWLDNSFWPYLTQCQRNGVNPLDAEAYYRSQLRGTGQ
jgi:hypothetical protein